MSRRRSKQSYEYDVALSFAGEDRLRAEELAKLLIKDDVSVFYDEFLKATLWGKDLYQHLAKIYKDRAQYCVVFVSKAYVSKNWTKHELQHAQARSFGSDREYILPLRIDDTVLPGLAPTIGYLDIRTTRIAQVAATLLEKLGKKNTSLHEGFRPADWNGEKVEYNGVMVASFWPKNIEAAQHKPSSLVTRPFDRIRYGKEDYWKRYKRKPPPLCHDCAALIGQYHVSSCDMEQCPSCNNQRISCNDHRSKAISDDELRAWEEGE